MSEDPKRWADDPSIADDLREVMRRERTRNAGLAPPPLSRDLREAMRGGLPTEPGRARWMIGGLSLLAAAALLMLFWPVPEIPEEHVGPGQPRIVREPGDAGIDAGAPQRLHVERICGDLEETDQQCAIVVDLPSAVSRLTLHRAIGRVAPACDTPPEHERAYVASGSIRIEVANGGERSGHDAYRACAWSGDRVIASGDIEGQRRGASVQIAPRYDGHDLVITFGLDTLAFDLDARGYRLVRAPFPAESYDDMESRPELDCEGQTVARWSRALVEGVRVDRDPLFESTIAIGFRAPRSDPMEGPPAFVVCVETASGLEPASEDRYWPFSVWPEEEPMIATPSGEIPASGVLEGHALLSVAELTGEDEWGPTDLRVTRARAAPRESVRWDEESAPFVFESERSVALPRAPMLDHTQRALRINTLLSRTQHVVGTLRSEESARWPFGWRVDAPIFVNGLATEGSGHGGRSEPALRIEDEPIRAMPAERLAGGCSLNTVLEIDRIPDGVTEIGLAVRRHEGPRGTLLEMQCDEASFVRAWPVALLRELPADEAGTRRLVIDTHIETDEIDDDESVCSAAFAALACVRDASGLHALDGALGRWDETGPACFAAGTLIATPRGTSRIEALRPGDAVIAIEPSTGDEIPVRVHALLPRAAQPTLRVEVEGAILHVTGEHPLLDADRGVFREAASYRVGDRLVGRDGAASTIRAIEQSAPTPVYDLSVGPPHTYLANGIVAHNY